MNAEIAALEKQIEDLKVRLSDVRRRATPEPVGDYELHEADGRKVTLRQLFGGRPDLLAIHNMGQRCAYCTLWADGFNGLLPHLENRAAFAVFSPDESEPMRAFAAGRNWRMRMISFAGTSFAQDLGYFIDGKYWPGVSALHRRADGSIVRVGKAVFGPNDDFCSAWRLFDLLPGGAGDWAPKFRYEPSEMVRLGGAAG